MIRRLLFATLVSACFVNLARADQAPASPDAKSPSADDILTNNLLRAYSGSTNPWSFAGTLNYAGGTLRKPFGEDRPNLSAGGGNTAKTDFDGTLNIKYNLDSLHSLFMGFGVRWIAPFTHGAIGPNPDGSPYAGQREDAVNPTLTYQYIYKWVGIQSVLQFQFTQWTQTDQTAAGYLRNYAVDQENVYDIKFIPGLSIGASVGGQFNDFNAGDNSAVQGEPETYSQSFMQVWFNPYMEYALTEKISLRSLLLLMWEQWRVDPKSTWRQDKVYQSVGIGFSVTRDIYVYPNVQFYPDNSDSDLTNVAVSTTINF